MKTLYIDTRAKIDEALDELRRELKTTGELSPCYETMLWRVGVKLVEAKEILEEGFGKTVRSKRSSYN